MKRAQSLIVPAALMYLKVMADDINYVGIASDLRYFFFINPQIVCLSRNGFP